MFSESSPCLLGEHGSCSTAQRPVELSENILQNLFHNLPPQTCASTSVRILTLLFSDAISCEERGESDGDLVVALYTMGKTELLKAAASAQHVIDLNRRREIANTVKMANERIASIMNR